MRIRQGEGFITMDQERYAIALLRRFRMDQCHAVGTPLVPKTELKPRSTQGGASLEDDPLLQQDEITRYREIVGSLMYLVACTRVDLAVAVNQLSRCMVAPTKSHMTAAKHVLRYLKGTAGLGLRYERGADDKSNIIDGYTDATWANVPKTSRSLSGYVFFLNQAAVSWKCSVQKVVSLSTAEAEYISLCEAVREAVYLRNLMQEMGLPQAKPTIVYEDNQPCIHLSWNPTTSNRLKHIAMRFNFVREKLEAGVVDVQYCPTADNVADALTKILPKPMHLKHRAQLLNLQE
jgi:hypothetical protein